MSYVGDIEDRARQNARFREVLATGPHSQVVVMSIPPGEDIGAEVHEKVDQVLVVVSGEGAAILDGERTAIGPGWLVQVPAGVHHDLVNTGPEDLRLYTVYAPPQHAPGTVHETKAEADAAEAAEAAETLTTAG
jgi:mannose-6-phosphate isomerase-like protein (cupin superfamily)